MTAAPANDLRPLLGRVAGGHALSECEAEAAFEIIMSGNATPSQMGAFLMGLRVRGETVDEITGAARIMRAKALAIDAPPGTIDTVGTGGDGSGTFNISTASALVVAGAACRWPSTATAPSPQNRARPTCWRRSVSISIATWRSSAAACGRSASVF